MNRYLSLVRKQKTEGKKNRWESWHTEQLREMLKLLDQDIGFIRPKEQEKLAVMRQLESVDIRQLEL